MKLNPEKLAEQQQIIEKWKEAGGRGSVVAVTGLILNNNGGFY
jgi:hypothetical protein